MQYSMAIVFILDMIQQNRKEEIKELELENERDEQDSIDKTLKLCDEQKKELEGVKKTLEEQGKALKVLLQEQEKAGKALKELHDEQEKALNEQESVKKTLIELVGMVKAFKH